MEHNMNTPVHWGYSSSAAIPTTSHWPQNHGIKRTISESDGEELYSEESSKEQISPSESGSCQMMSRKKRRGVIEKKRRDRINSSLSELKRLVPSAYEKQGSAKLEKAEILQLTVEHLKSLHSKGIDSLNYDPQRFAMDYHIIGFRECAAEVARYLVTIEGMDIQDPLRLRLMSHLQYFVQQRELSVKGSASNTWTTGPSTGAYQPNCSVTAYQSYPSSVHTHAATTSSYVPNGLPPPIHPYPIISSPPNSIGSHSINVQQQHQQQQQQQQLQNPIHVNRPRSTSLSTTSENMPIINHVTPIQAPPQNQHTHAPQSPLQPHQNQQHYSTDHGHHSEHSAATYIELTNAQSSHSTHPNGATGPAGTNSVEYTNSAQFHPVTVAQEYNLNTSLNYASATGNGSKQPYRPWGAEMAY